MKRKLFFCIRNFKQGGISRCLQTLLQCLDAERYAVEVFALDHIGPYKGNMPNCVILPEDPIIHSLQVYRKEASLKDLFFKSIRKIGLTLFRWDLLEWRFRKVAQGINCDVAIAYAEGDFTHLVQFTSAPTKIVWVHNDYRFAKESTIGTPFETFERIVCCSSSALKSFVELYPNLNDRAIAIHNLVNVEQIRALSLEEENEIDRAKMVVVSIGRIDYPKHFDIIPQIAAQLKGQIDFNWYIIGDGPQSLKEEVFRAIEKFDVSEEVHLLGSKDNPYKYLKGANVMAVTSRFECYPTVVNEALSLGVPVVMNDIPVASEMLSPENGIVTDYDHFAEAIIAAQSLKVEFVDENEMILQQLEDLMK